MVAKPTVVTNPTNPQVPRLAEGVVIRPESFGGLLFSPAVQSILELNQHSYELLSLVDGSRTTEEIVSAHCTCHDVDPGSAREFLQALRMDGLLL